MGLLLALGLALKLLNELEESQKLCVGEPELLCDELALLEEELSAEGGLLSLPEVQGLAVLLGVLLALALRLTALLALALALALG